MLRLGSICLFYISCISATSPQLSSSADIPSSSSLSTTNNNHIDIHNDIPFSNSTWGTTYLPLHILKPLDATDPKHIGEFSDTSSLTVFYPPGKNASLR